MWSPLLDKWSFGRGRNHGGIRVVVSGDSTEREIVSGTGLSDKREEMLARADALAPEFRARAAEGETNRTMPADLAAKVKKAGLFRLSLPASLGGWEADPITLFEVIEKLSYADGSAGWTMLIGSSPR